jgi:hypothetical protein
VANLQDEMGLFGVTHLRDRKGLFDVAQLQIFTLSCLLPIT